MRNTQTSKNDKNVSTDDSIRLDKFLKVSRIIKRRSVAKDFCDADRVLINNRDSKPSSKIKVGDILDIKFGITHLKVKILNTNEKAKKDDAKEMYEVLEETKEEKE